MALTDYIIMPSVDYQAACDKLREKSGKTELIKSGDLATEIEAIAGSGSMDGEYVEYTLDESANIIAASFHNFKKIPTHFFVNTFNQYDNLASIDLSLSPELIEIGQYAFNGCSALTSVKLPNSLRIIGDNAFYRCSKLPIPELPESLETVGIEAFDGCLGPETLVLPASITHISGRAFANNTSIINVEIRCNLTKNNIFVECTGLHNAWIRNTCNTINASEYWSPFKSAMKNEFKIYAEVSEKPDGWSEYFNSVTAISGDTSITSAEVIYGQTECPW